MPIPIRRPDTVALSVFRGSLAVQDGALTPKALRGSGWVRLRYDVYADSRLEHDHELSCRAAALTLPDTAVISGLSAAYLLGVRHAADFASPVHVTVPPLAPRPRDNMVVHRTALDPSHVESMSWCRHTTAARTAWDVSAGHDIVTAVSVLDVMLRLGIVTPGSLKRMIAQRGACRGSRKAARAFGLADGRAQSPPESRMRVRLILAGLPPPVPQFPVRVPSGLILHPDAAWPEYKVAAEYDGEIHEGELDLDRSRMNLLQEAGWRVVCLTKRRMTRDFAGFARQVRTELVRQGWRPEHPRSPDLRN